MAYRKDRRHISHRQKARKISKQYQLQPRLALMVAKNELTLGEAIRHHNETLNVERIIEDNNIHPSDAAQIKSGKVTVEGVVYRNNFKRHLTDNANRSILTDAMDKSRPLTLWLHKQQVINGFLSELTQYRFMFREGQVVHEIPKVNVKAASFSRTPHRLVRSRSAHKDPIHRIEERFRISNKRLYSFIHAKSTLDVELLEGVVFTGKLAWIGRFELGLIDKRGRELSLFRHALHGIKER